MHGGSRPPRITFLHFPSQIERIDGELALLTLFVVNFFRFPESSMNLSRATGHVGASLLAKPCFFIRSRQHEPVFPGLAAPLLAPCSRQSLVSSSSHANTGRFFPGCQCRCWRRPPLKAFALHPATPTGRPESIPAAGGVGASLLACWPRRAGNQKTYTRTAISA